MKRILGDHRQMIDSFQEEHKGDLTSISAADTHNNRIEVTISDSGVGISPKNVKKVFAPFFINKLVGNGTRPGLSVCYGIFKNLGGEMSAFSAKGSGTIFRINLSVYTDCFNRK